MSVIYIVFPLALLIACAAVGAFIWSVRSGQLDDLETPPLRMLGDDQVASRRTSDGDKHASEQDGIEPDPRLSSRPRG